MNCRQVERRLSNYLEGRLSGTAADAVAAHLHACTSCRCFRDDIIAAEAELSQQSAPIPPPDIERRAVRLWLSQREAPPAGVFRIPYSVFGKDIRSTLPLWDTNDEIRNMPPPASSARRSLLHTAVLVAALLLAVLGLELPAAGGASRSGPSYQALLTPGPAGHGSYRGEA